MEENDRKWPKDFRADGDDVDVGEGCVQPVPAIVINLQKNCQPTLDRRSQKESEWSAETEEDVEIRDKVKATVEIGDARVHRLGMEFNPSPQQRFEGIGISSEPIIGY